MTPSKILFYLCISFVVGVALESVVKIPQMGVWGIFVFGVLIIGISLFFKYYLVNAIASTRFYLVAGFCILVLVLGIMRFQISEFDIAGDKLRQLNDGAAKITLTGQVADEPDVRDAMQKLKVNVEGSLVLVTVRNGTTYRYLDTVTITGKLKTPAVFEDFNYKNYLLKDGIYSVMDYPKIDLVSTQHSYNIFTYSYDKILFFKDKVRGAIYANFMAPQSQLLEGILLGNNKNMGQQLRDKLNAAGLRYLTAISGVHVIVLMDILMLLCLALGFWRGQAFYIALVFVWLYIVLTGFTASGIRAATMGSIFLLSQKLGRQNTSARVITLAGALMLLQNPLLLKYDVGFQLSFLASLGIIHFKPLISPLIKVVPGVQHLESSWKVYWIEMLAVTISAQVFIFPMLIYNFGNVSLVAPITSLLVLPIIPWIMVTGFLMSLTNMIVPAANVIFALPCFMLLAYFIKVLDIFSGAWSLLTISGVSWLWPAGYYIILFSLTYFLRPLTHAH